MVDVRCRKGVQRLPEPVEYDGLRSATLDPGTIDPDLLSKAEDVEVLTSPAQRRRSTHPGLLAEVRTGGPHRLPCPVHVRTRLHGPLQREFLSCVALVDRVDNSNPRVERQSSGND